MWTPLHGAACFGEVAVTRYLVVHGANLHAANENGDTPLGVAVEETTKRYLQGLFLSSSSSSFSCWYHSNLNAIVFRFCFALLCFADCLRKLKSSTKLYALYDYAGQDAEELSFKRGELLTIDLSSEVEGDAWLRATNESQQAGLVPHNYFSVTQPFY